MKKIKNLKLLELEKKELQQNEAMAIRGGEGNCQCGCNGPSSMQDNSAANYRYSYHSGGGGICWCNTEYSDQIIKDL